MTTLLTMSSQPLVPTDALRWRRTFLGRAEEGAALREFVGFLLFDCKCGTDAVLTADELFGNAIAYTRSGQLGGLVTIEVRRWNEGCVSIAVADQGGTSEPRSKPLQEIESPDEIDDLDEHGRGLQTIGNLATRWGWHGNEKGRTVTAVFEQ
jgi:serine/threonine-protein kinase RsbW